MNRRDQRGAIWILVLFVDDARGMQNQDREDQQQTKAYGRRGGDCDETTNEKLHRKKVEAARTADETLSTQGHEEEGAVHVGHPKSTVDARKKYGRHRNQFEAILYNNGMDPVMYAATLPSEAVEQLALTLAERE